MNRVLNKRIFRDLKSNFLRYLALLLMIVMGMYIIVSVVGAADLFSNQELAALGERLKGLSALQEQERLKMRADELLDNRNEWAAMEEYRHILRMHQIDFLLHDLADFQMGKKCIQTTIHDSVIHL